ncbi:hypothetical protein RhiirB3_476119 [Rhizophagus irregularis]|nr:hypothetical protein RhiirB3_476119 [Rhizophagus irregularis]
MNLHAATSLAEDLGLDLVDIYRIYKWIQMQASPLNDSDIVAEMVRNLPVEEFRKHLKINRLWYNYCKAELWKRHEKAEEAYDRAVEKKEKAGDTLGQSLEKEGNRNRDLCELEWKAYQKACKELSEARKEHGMDIWCSGDWNLTEYIIKWLAGLGKSIIITDFIQRSVLGTQLVYKTSDPQTILGSFNGQLQGKVLLLFEEMPTEKSQWNNLYRLLKDKVTGDIMEIHEKYKTPTHYKNFISTIVLTNENALRVENDDRRTVFLDVSPSRKGDLNYFKKLGNAMKYPGTSEAFYVYLRAIADAYPNFNENPPPITASK